jgi:acyl-CoA synthetase (AMP-forming)/AMP-acid ligase II
LKSRPTLAGLADARMGEEVAAFVRLNDREKPLTVGDVRDHCEGKMAHFKVPRYVFNVEDFPRTLSGKIQKFKFVEYYGDEIGKAVGGE